MKLARPQGLVPALVVSALSLAGVPPAQAQDTIKIGVLAQFSGQFADFGQQIGNGIETFESPRGPIRIDPDTRDVVQPIYIRQVERRDGELVNKEIFTFPSVYNHLNK